mmetsp:Transcript_90463/g.240273  ORF Transcript_90463/g.240273 Transcript_90463/m.240273 type:complete len:379 (-) Transcript_90463:225-1361(-)
MPPMHPMLRGGALGATGPLWATSEAGPPTSPALQMWSALTTLDGALQGRAEHALQAAQRDTLPHPQWHRHNFAPRLQTAAPPSPGGSVGSPRAPLEEVARDRRERHLAAGMHDELLNRGAISQLQEFVQGAKIYPMPPNCPVLQWDYETRMMGTSLKFKAIVAFLLDGVPHHAAGTWKASKKIAQRDAAERALGLFVNRWGALALEERCAASWPQNRGIGSSSSSSTCMDARVQLEEFCGRLVPHVAMPLHWRHRWEGKFCQAFVDVRLMEVDHTFPSRSCQSIDVAYMDVARRVLWYLQCPGFEDAFEPDFEYVRAAAQTIPEPALGWVREADSEGEDQQSADRTRVGLPCSEPPPLYPLPVTLLSGRGFQANRKLG